MRGYQYAIPRYSQTARTQTYRRKNAIFDLKLIYFEEKGESIVTDSVATNSLYNKRL